MSKKLKLLLIDDDPKLVEKIKRIPGFSQHPDGDKMIPFVTNDAPMGRDVDPSVRKRMMIASEAFEVKWLKSPKDIKNYLNIVKTVTYKYGKQNLSKFCFIPDIIVFDYSLTQGMNDPLNFSDDILSFIDPNYIPVNYLKQKGHSIELSEENIKHSIEVEQDTLGLFLSTLILEIYAQEYPCIGIPITFFKDKLEGKDAHIFEWVVNEYYNEVMKWKGKGNKSWHEIIDFSLPLYQDKLLTQIKQSRITINPSHLYELLNGGYLVKKGEVKRGIDALSFKTIYGEKSINLDYLFINTNPFNETEPTESQKKAAKDALVKERDIEIDIFLHKVVDAVIQLANVGLGIKEIVKAKEIADTLFSDYLTDFEDRIDLSEFTSRNGSLDRREQNNLKDLLIKFSVKDQKIASEKEKSILNYKNSQNPQIIRLAILYLITDASIKLSKLYKISNKKSQYRELDEQEIYYLLNPVVNTNEADGLRIPMHFENGSDVRAVLDKFCQSLIRSYLDKTEPQPKRNKSFFDFSTWISPGEKIILKSFFNEEESLLPPWLK